MLVTPEGRVLWREDGVFTPAAGAGLMAALDAAQPGATEAMIKGSSGTE